MDWPIIFDGIDDGSAALIVELQRADIENISHSIKGKQREGDINDIEMSLQLWSDELTLLETNHRGHLMAQSIVAAIWSDSMLINGLLEQEVQVREDHHYALRIRGLSTDEPDSDQDSGSDGSLNEEMRVKILTREFADLYGLRTAPWIKTDAPVAESFKWAASRKPAGVAASGACIACRDEMPWFDIAKAPCDDDYCVGCLSALFESSMTDESLYPPRCCGQTIPFQLVRPFLLPDIGNAFDIKRLELDTKDRTYCFAPYCATFISKDRIDNDVATCPSCSRTTCTMCKESAHEGDCPRDTTLQVLIDTANNEGWQRCYSCRRMVELDMGCNHMTCICRAQFCYVCGLQWKSCACETWEENRLYGRAVHIAARAANPRRRLYQPPGGILVEEFNIPLDENEVAVALPMAQLEAEPDAFGDRPGLNALDHIERDDPLNTPPNELPNMHDESEIQVPPSVRVPSPIRAVDTGVARGIDQIMRDLRANHECVHRNWLWIKGPRRCEECFHTLPHYIFECQQCELQACWRCRKNRL